MKNTLKSGLFVCIILLMATGISVAGNRNGAGGGTGPIHDILAGIPFEIEGVVVTVGLGQGIEIATTDAETLTVYGFGPLRYWAALAVDRPAVGDDIQVRGYLVDYNGVERHIATSVEIGGVEVLLRDEDTGLPLWRGNMFRTDLSAADYR